MIRTTLAAVVLTAVTSSAFGLNLLADPSFEAPLTYDGAPFVGSWEGFLSGADAFSETTTSVPRTGAQSLELQIFGVANQFAGVFQDVPNLLPGELISWEGYHANIGADSGGIEIRIEWRDSVNDVEISRTPNFVPTPGTSYEFFQVTDTVPAGADSARVVYAIQSFGGALNQRILVDDVAVTPEPASLVALGLGVLAVIRRR